MTGLGGLLGELLEQPRLADAGLAAHHGQAALLLSEEGRQLRELRSLPIRGARFLLVAGFTPGEHKTQPALTRSSRARSSVPDPEDTAPRPYRLVIL